MTTTSRSSTRAILLILISSCCFGSLSTLTLFTTRSGLLLVPAMFWRYSLAVLILTLTLRGRLAGYFSSSQAWKLVAVGGIGQATVTYLSLRALDYLPVGPLAFLFYTYPAWVAVISAITGRERLTISRLIALAIAMTGIAVMVGTPFAGSLNVIGVSMALGAALLYALYLPALHSAQQGMPAGVSTFFLMFGVLLAFLLASVFTHQLQIPRSPTTWKFVLLLSIIGTVIAFGTLIAGLRVLGPVRTSIVSTVEPFFTAMLGVALLDETLTAGTIAGGVMIAAAVIILEWTGRDRTAPVAV
ncbi:MAG: DMT family transporter [Gemmatimonadales bacterium]